MIRLILPLVLAATVSLAACENSERRAERHFESGVALLESGEVSQALLELRNAVRLKDDFPEARVLIARTLRERGEAGAAFAEYQRLVDQHPDSLEGRLALGELAFESANWEAAERHGRAALELAPDDRVAQLIGAALDYRDASIASDANAAGEAVATVRAHLDEVSEENLTAWRIVIDHTANTSDRGALLSTLNAAIEARPDIYDFHRMRLGILAELEREADIPGALRAMLAQFPEREEPRGIMVAWYMQQGDLAAAEAFLRELTGAPDAGASEKLVVVEFLRLTSGDDAALEELDQLIAAEPDATADLATYRALRASIRFERGERDTALSEMQSLLEETEADERTNNLRLVYAQMLLATDAEDQARTQVDRILEDDASHVEALKLRATWLIEADRPGEALAALRTAQGAAPRDPQLMMLMGQAHERGGERDLAGERYALAAEFSGNAAREALNYARYLFEADRIDSAESVLSSALNVSPQSLPLMRAMAEVQMRRNDWDRVTRLVWQMRALDTDAGNTAANEVEAELLLRQGRTQDTITFLEGMVRDGAGVGAVAQLARTQVMQGEPEGARRLIEEQLAAEPGNPALRFLRAGLYLLEDDTEEAEQIYRDLVAEYPGAEPPLRVLYSLLQMQGRDDEAEAVIDAALDAAPGAPMPRVLRASELERRGDIDGAIAIYEELYAADTNNLILANNLASLISAHRDDEESLNRATAIAQRLRGIDIPAFQDTYGWIQYRRGNYAEALEYLEPAAAGLPDDPLVQYHLGMTYLALERSQEAQETLERALTIAGEDNLLPQFRRAREVLQSLDAG
ncbi:tetratricopeptide repeat protein [Pararhodobacter sp. SW119]|uniref:tetratricopeptide repeat protein n=1 Tax=Pararhodobacter sp. SW119 TaxID=2780075 RepID=UPI001AE00998|nr:tetratricopeptide repeat protein [Pararhodobacter sp. SW119]